MFSLRAEKNVLNVLAREPITSGSVNVYDVAFQFSSDWEGLERTAVFRAGGVSHSVSPGESGLCQIPWEVLQAAGVWLYAGVCGTRDQTVVLPTIWASLGIILEGTPPVGGGGDAGSWFDHRKLSNRDAEDQHPIDAISGLREALEQIPAPMTADELRKILMK